MTIDETDDLTLACLAYILAGKFKGEKSMSGELQSVEIWCDGACSGNPGAAGWGAVLVYGRMTDGADWHYQRLTAERDAIVERLQKKP